MGSFFSTFWKTGFGPHWKKNHQGISARKPCGTFWMGISMEGFHKHVEQNRRAGFRAKLWRAIFLDMGIDIFYNKKGGL
jgi:hypothetical protein